MRHVCDDVRRAEPYCGYELYDFDIPTRSDGDVWARYMVRRQEFRDYGLDSMDAVVVGGALEERFDVEVDATLFLRNRSIDELMADLRRSRLVE